MIKKTGFNLYIFIFLCFTALFLKPYTTRAQSKPMFGIMVKPIIQTELFSSTTDKLVEKGVTYQVSPEGGYNAGMVVRHRVFKGISLETGISYVRRGFNITLQDSAFSSNTRFRYINYEIPLLGLIYIQLSKRAFINNAFGLSLDFFPSHISTEGDSIRQITYKKYWVLPSLTANIGFEYRTKKSGFFYVGGSYHRLLTTMAYSRIHYQRSFTQTETVILPLSGHYFSVDLKYFLPVREKDPEPIIY